jgi:hypothetical protein
MLVLAILSQSAFSLQIIRGCDRRTSVRRAVFYFHPRPFDKLRRSLRVPDLFDDFDPPQADRFRGGRSPKATPAACTPPAQAKRLDPRAAAEGGALQGPTRPENGGAQPGSARPRGRPRRRRVPVPRALRRPLSLDHPVGCQAHAFVGTTPEAAAGAQWRMQRSTPRAASPSSSLSLKTAPGSVV